MELLVGELRPAEAARNCTEPGTISPHPFCPPLDLGFPRGQLFEPSSLGRAPFGALLRLSTLHSHQWPAIVPGHIRRSPRCHSNEHNTFAFASPYAVIIMPQSTEKNERRSNALGGGGADVKKACFLDATKRILCVFVLELYFGHYHDGDIVKRYFLAANNVLPLNDLNGGIITVTLVVLGANVT
eukprot:scaffold118677_cov76-Cyclotella_meneghiniana.AAC.1